MKHKILLATSASEEFDNLLSDLLNLLNRTHKKYISAFSPSHYQESKLVAVGINSSGIKPLDHLVADFEKEAIIEKKASEHNLDFEWLQGAINEERLSSLSTVSDLLIVEQEAFDSTQLSVFEELLSIVKCPILLLPKDWEIENLVIFHDGSTDSVKMIKDFLNLFNPALRDLPLSVLISHTAGRHDVKSEKVFIDYLKLFFNNIGIQLIQGDLIDNLTESVVYNSNKPFLMLGVKVDEVSGQQALGSPTFLFKG